MFGCIWFWWRNKPVVFAYLVLNSWWQCMHSAFVSSFFWKCSQTELLFTFFLYTISSALLPATTTLLSLSLDIFFQRFLIFIKFTQILKYTSELAEFLSDTAQQRTLCPSTKHAVTRSFTSGHTILRIRVSNNFTGRRNWTVYLHIL